MRAVGAAASLAGRAVQAWVVSREMLVGRGCVHSHCECGGLRGSSSVAQTSNGHSNSLRCQAYRPGLQGAHEEGWKRYRVQGMGVGVGVVVGAASLQQQASPRMTMQSSRAGRPIVARGLTAEVGACCVVDGLGAVE